MGMDALTLVREDHRRLEALLERCERLEGDDGDREAFLGQLQSAIRHHVDQEESILYTIFRERARGAAPPSRAPAPRPRPPPPRPAGGGPFGPRCPAAPASGPLHYGPEEWP